MNWRAPSGERELIGGDPSESRSNSRASGAGSAALTFVDESFTEIIVSLDTSESVSVANSMQDELLVSSGTLEMYEVTETDNFPKSQVILKLTYILYNIGV
ncbi:hypothetical protein [Halovenus marina]|uniref:hypothetical protein n=1 Tax=Halovenus marina TaxID=3396621 RepID=UPI003F571F40